MVRLEKILYERIVNSEAIGRARKLTTPAKWFTANPYQHQRKISYEVFYNSPVGRLFRPFFQSVFNFQRKYQRGLLLQQGLTFEDKFLHDDLDLRRGVLFQHMVRQSLHPYHWILKSKRRERYYRIQRGIRGYFVPQFIRSQTKTQTYEDFRKLSQQWITFTHDNYFSDMTPTARRTIIPSLAIFDLFMNYGILRSQAWDRYFFAERDLKWCTEEQLKVVRNQKKFPFDLTTAEGKKQFEIQVNKVNAACPGLVAIEGEKFDFQKYYASIGV